MDQKKLTLREEIKLNDFLRESNAIEDVRDNESIKHARFAWEYLNKQKELDVYIVQKAHGILMRNQELQPNEKGYFRHRPVWIGGREGLPWYVLPEAMEVWCQNAWLSPKNWKAHHVRFEYIHPFIDGNGRLGRLLMNWERIKAGLSILVIKEIEKYKYYKWFE